MQNTKNQIIKNIERQNRRGKPPLSEKMKNTFNLPAFALPFIYNMCYKRYKMAATFVAVTWLPHLISKFANSWAYSQITVYCYLFLFIYALYSGVTGNKSAYEARKYADEDDFVESQRWWLPFAIIAIIVNLALIPVRLTGHNNTYKMIKLAEEVCVLNNAIQKGLSQRKMLGIDATGPQLVPMYFATYLDGIFDDVDTIKMDNGTTFTIEGYDNQCQDIGSTTYHEAKTACASVIIDFDGPDAGKNQTMLLSDLQKIRSLLNKNVKLQDRYTMYAYADGVAPKATSIEEFAMERFGRK